MWLQSKALHSVPCWAQRVQELPEAEGNGLLFFQVGNQVCAGREAAGEAFLPGLFFAPFSSLPARSYVGQRAEGGGGGAGKGMHRCTPSCKEGRLICLGKSRRDSGGPQTSNSSSPGSASSLPSPNVVVISIDLHKSPKLNVASLSPGKSLFTCTGVCHHYAQRTCHSALCTFKEEVPHRPKLETSKCPSLASHLQPVTPVCHSWVDP